MLVNCFRIEEAASVYRDIRQSIHTRRSPFWMTLKWIWLCCLNWCRRRIVNMETVKHYLQQPYARIVIPVEHGGFHAEILEFPGCYAQGDNLDEAYSNL